MLLGGYMLHAYSTYGRFRLLEPVLEPREKFLRTAHSLLNISWLTLGRALKLDT